MPTVVCFNLQYPIPGGLSEDRVPLTGPAQTVLLIVGFVAGAAGAILVVFLVPVRPMLQALIYFVMILLIDFAAAVAWWNVIPAWFAIAMVVLVPLQVWAGRLSGCTFEGGRWRLTNQPGGSCK